MPVMDTSVPACGWQEATERIAAWIDEPGVRALGGASEGRAGSSGA